MSKYDRDIQDVYAVKQLGDAIGYGHLMAIAHELWARHLESKGWPRRGAHCVVGYPMVKEQFQAEALNDKIYTIIVGKALEADRKTEPNNSEKPNNCEPQYEMGMETLKCDNCSEYGSFKCTKCDGEMYFKRLEPNSEPQTEREGE